jgi:hypothetical protein
MNCVAAAARAPRKLPAVAAHSSPEFLSSMNGRTAAAEAPRKLPDASINKSPQKQRQPRIARKTRNFSCFSWLLLSLRLIGHRVSPSNELRRRRVTGYPETLLGKAGCSPSVHLAQSFPGTQAESLCQDCLITWKTDDWLTIPALTDRRRADNHRPDRQTTSRQSPP